MRTTMSLLGLYNYDSTLLDGLTLPDNFDDSDLDILKNNLLIETAEFEILYNNPDFLKLAITQWCEKRKSTWKWLKDTQQYSYNPIWNVDYTQTDATTEKIADDTITDFTRNLQRDYDNTTTRNLSEDKTGTERLVVDGTDKKSGTDTTLHSVYSYNESSSAQPESSDSSTYGSQIDTDSTSTTTYNTSLANTGTIKDDATTSDTGTTKEVVDNDKTRTLAYSKVLQGNYGQTTTQEMIKGEQELAQLNLIDFIISDFEKRFCLLVY